MINFAANLNKMIDAGLGGPLDPPRTEVAVGHRVIYTEASGDVVNFETNVIAPVKNLRVTMEPIQAGSGDPSPENIRPITGRDVVNVYRSGVDMSDPLTVTIQLGQTVYGGTLDVATGVLTVDRAIVDLGTLEWTKSGNFFYSNLAGGIPASSSSMVADIICSSYKTVSRSYQTKSDPVDASISYNLAAGTTERLFILDTQKNALGNSEFKAAMSGIMLCYERATPQTLTLTPAQLTTLAGENNIWSDAGNISLEYPTFEYMEGY